MRNDKTLSLTDSLMNFLRGTELEKSVLKVQVEEVWPQVMGETVGKLTRSVELKNGVLIVHLSSAALKTQLFENRFELVKKLNAALGADAIKDCRLLG